MCVINVRLTEATSYICSR